MKIKSPTKKLSKKTVLLSSAGVIVLMLGYGAFAMSTNNWPFTENPNSTNQTPSEESSDDASKTNAEPQTLTPPEHIEGEPDSPKTPAENAPAPQPPKGTVGVTITSIHEVGDAVKIRTLIETITSNGSCTLTFEKASQTVTRTSKIQALPSSSTCEGFSIPTNELSSGNWHVTLSVDTGDKTGSASRDYEVK